MGGWWWRREEGRGDSIGACRGSWRGGVDGGRAVVWGEGVGRPAGDGGGFGHAA